MFDTLIKIKDGSLFLESINSMPDRCRAVIAAKWATRDTDFFHSNAICCVLKTNPSG